MKEFCALDYEMCSGHFFKKGRLREENIYIHELDITVTKYTLMCGRRIPPRLMKTLAGKTGQYNNVFPLFGEAAHLKKRGNDISLMTLMPLAALKKCAGICGADLENEQVAINVKALSAENEQIITQLCRGISFARLYGLVSEPLCEKIMAETGLCVSCGAGEPEEKFRIVLEKNLTFEHVPCGRTYKELAVRRPAFLDKYKKVIPSDEIFDAFLKSGRGKEYINTKNVKIIGIM